MSPGWEKESNLKWIIIYVYVKLTFWIKAVGKIQVMKWLSELLFNFRLLDFESAFKDILKSHTLEAIMK